MEKERRTWNKFYEKLSIKSNAVKISDKIMFENILLGLLAWRPWVNKGHMVLVDPN